MGWKHGSVDIEPLKVKAYSFTKVAMELDWTVPNVTKDFSLIVYGDDGPISIQHTDPEMPDESKKFPVIERKED